MNEQALQTYLNLKIPQSVALAAQVEQISSDKLMMSAPLEPNINHRDSVFGGSASSIAILCAWAFLHSKLKGLGINTTLVIQKNTMSYDAPILGRFNAEASLAAGQNWDKFLKILSRRGKARIEVQSQLTYQDAPAGLLIGSFVAVNNK
ncbi:thioesterase domain-containing protein [Paraglaciecola aquimarina]|uniref:Thioesterase domain-containing protein n=1 Tax=Paraglaciecola algarum TaxID=3050085 RepID=A0ABS9D0S7_9ALTE|nr:YiiD C-terminal domain-containing protein [Paraglaciecola sp. G1-23]MCF2946531.1 thioesterase domain-containing protein [Paraglaciecola sp. G1-23]